MSTDQELFDQISSGNAGEPAAPEPIVETQPEPVQQEPIQAEQPRSPDGKFASKEIAEAPVDTQPLPEKEEARNGIPAWRLAEVTQERNKSREELQAMQAQFQAMQAQLRQFQEAQAPKPQAPDVFSDPEGYSQHFTQTLEQRLAMQEANFSFRLAKIQHGEKFDEAYRAAETAKANGDVNAINAIRNSHDPGEALMRWHRQQTLYSATGGDLEAFIARQKEEWLKDPATQAKAIELARTHAGGMTNPAQAQPKSVIQMPSLSKVGTTSAPSGEALSDRELFDQISTRRRSG